MSLPKSHNELSQKLQEALGIPPGMTVSSPYPFKGMNVHDSRTTIEDQEFRLIENFILDGNGKMRAVWDQGSPIYTPTGGLTVVFFYFYTIALMNYCAIFLSDGTAVQVNTATLVQTPIPAGSGLVFYNGGQLPCAASWGSQYLLIANNLNPNNYWIWDGSIVYHFQTLSPLITITSGGSGYSSAPTATAFGGTGSGATFAVGIANGSVVSVTPTNPGSGYSPSDIVQIIFSGGGSDNGAKLVAVLSSGSIDHIEILDPGTGGTPGTGYALGFSGGGGSGATGTYDLDAGGSVTNLVLTSGGSGYTGTPTVTFPSGAVTGVISVAILTSGTVASVTVVDGGTGFASTPVLQFEGGAGTGAAATATLSGGAITSVAVTNPGSGYTSPPTVVVQSGINNAASATAALMPFGVSGSAIETYQQRVWLTFPNQQARANNAGTMLVSAPGSYTDFATSSGGLVYVSSSPFLRAQYFNIKQSNGYLYPFGDSSIDVISNVQTSGSPSTTTFNYQNTDPQTGTSWRDSYVAYSRSILFANIFGVFGLYGGSAAKISEKMNDLFTDGVFPPAAGAVTPSGAVANIFSQKLSLLLMTITDPVTFAVRNAMIGWDEHNWCLLTQSSTLTFIATQVVNSDLIAYGTDGSKVFPMFQSPSSTLNKRLVTKLYGSESQIIQKEADMVVIQAQDVSTGQAGITFQTATIDNENGSYPLPNPVTFSAPRGTNTVYSAKAAEVPGCNIGMTLISNSPDFEINYLAVGHRNVSSIYGSQNLQQATGE